MGDEGRSRPRRRQRRPGVAARSGRIASEVRARGRSERGFTLTELLVGMALSLVVGAAALTFMVVSFHEQNIISSRAVASNQAEAGLEQLVRDLREATTSVTISTTGGSTSISFQVPTPVTDVAETASWTCPSTAATSVASCTRTLGSGAAKTEITGVQSIVFTPVYGGTATTPTNATDMASVGMTLTVRITSFGLSASSDGAVTTAVAGSGSAPIVLQAAADLRNFA